MWELPSSTRDQSPPAVEAWGLNHWTTREVPQAISWWASLVNLIWSQVVFWGMKNADIFHLLHFLVLCCCSVFKLCLTLCNPMDCNMPGFPVLPYLSEFAQTHVHWVSDAIQPFHPLSLLLLSSVFPSIRVFSSESSLPIRWPKYWSFSFSISPSNEYSGLISFRMNWFDLAAQRTLKSLLQHHSFESINSSALSLPYGPAIALTI